MAIVKLKQQNLPVSPITRNELNSADELNALIDSKGLKSVPLDVTAVARLLGIEVIEEPMDDDVSGFLEKRGDNWFAGVNSYHHPVRKRFTLAHEIGHFVLHRREQETFEDRTFARRANNPTRMEREADAFAASLLMPENAVRWEIANGLRNLNDLANAFNVSSLAMRYRLQSLGYPLS